MWLAVLAVIAGLALLVWSADRFVSGAASSARHLGMPPLLIGMVVVGFGTSAPELVVSVLAAMEDSTGIALGNAYGSNIANIALILGLTALVSPVVIQSAVLRKELPVLTAVTFLSIGLLLDYDLTRWDAMLLLFVFAGLMVWTVRQGKSQKSDALIREVEAEATGQWMPLKRSILRLVIGLLLFIVSLQVPIWGAVEIAQRWGVNDLMIGLTVVAVGTSLPELASSIVAARKGEHDIAFGNILGSNLLNTLAVVGLAGTIHPFVVEPALLSRDLAVMGALTVSLFFIGFGFHGRQGRINRWEGSVLILVYVGYTTLLILTAT
ncbi:MAG: calcium/sodium antiporter [Clostridiaceae bacterium]|nr:calcium/sodium antiporter [Clostridiaceae bacterium]